MENCVSCKSTLLIQHSFCPSCGIDLRNINIEKLKNEVKEENSLSGKSKSSSLLNTKRKFLISLISFFSIFVLVIIFNDFFPKSDFLAFFIENSLGIMFFFVMFFLLKMIYLLVFRLFKND